MKIKRLLPLALSLWLMVGIAAAEFSPAATAIRQGYLSGQPYSLRVSAQAEAWLDIAPETLAALRGWLDTARLSLTLQKRQDGETALAGLFYKDQPVFTIMSSMGDEQADMTLEVPGSLAATRFIGTVETPPWQLLLGAQPRLPDLVEVESAIIQIADLSMARLLPFEKAEKGSVSIKNAGRGASRLVYTLKAEEAQALWEQAKPEMLPLFGRLSAEMPRLGAPFLQGLGTLAFTRAFTLKRFLDKDGKDLGLQITGTVDISGQARRLTLFCGQSESGLYLSLKFPATRGRDTLEVQVSLAYKPGIVQGDWRYQSVFGEEKLEASGKVDLKSSPEKAGERISGSLSARLKLSGRTTDHLLTPDLFLTENTAEGTLGYKEQAGKAVLRDLAISLSLAPGGEITGPVALSEVHLAQADEEQISLSATQIQLALMPVLKDFLFALPMQTRLLVLHDIGRERRTQGESVAPLGEDMHQFTVTDTNVEP